MKLNVGMIGLTHPHAPAHLQTLIAMDEVEKIYLAEEDPDVLQSFSDHEKIAGTYDTTDPILSDKNVPIVEVLDRTDRAPSLMIDALNAGKHIITDKPAARTASELKPVVELAESKGLIFSVHYKNRWNPEIQQSRMLRLGGALGRIVSTEISMITTSVKTRNPKHWLFNKNIAGGGMLHWLGCHQIDLIRYVTGEEIVSVVASCKTLSGEDIDVEDVVAVTLGLSQGGIATIHAGYVVKGSASKADVVPRIEIPLSVRGTLGQMWIESGVGDKTLTLQSVASGWDSVAHHRYSYTDRTSKAYGGVSGIDFVRQMFKAAFEGAELPVSGRDALVVLQVMDAAYESSDTGRRVDL